MSWSRDLEEKEKKAGDSPKRSAEPLPLDPGLRARAEATVGRDLGNVRIHADAEAHAAAERQGAVAFTRDQEIYFAADQYQPTTQEGERLLVHELAHSLQQRGASSESAEPAALEGEADRTAEAVQGGIRSPIRLTAPPGRTQIQEKGKATVPTIQRHPEEIAPTPPQGTVSGGGFSIPYVYSSVQGGVYVPLVLQLPEGVSMIVTPLTDLREGTDYREQNAAGSKARAVVISVSSQLKQLPKAQVTFTRGSSSYLVVFQFPTSGKASR